MLLIPLPCLSRSHYGRAIPSPRISAIRGASIGGISIIPLKDTNGAITGIAAIMRDVTKRFEELKALRKQLASVKG